MGDVFINKGIQLINTQSTAEAHTYSISSTAQYELKNGLSMV